MTVPQTLPLTFERVARLRRALLALCALALGWSAAIALTGGFFLRIASVRFSSRNPRTAAWLALLSALAAIALPMPGGRWRALGEDWRRLVTVIGSLLSRWPWLRSVDAPAIVAGIGIALEITQWAAAPPLWLDEEMIALNVRDRSLAGLTGALWLGQSAPYGWLALERAVILAFGAGEHAVRVVPVLFGIATLVCAVWTGRRSMSALGAAVLVLLCTFGLWLSHYPLEVKHYSADVFWGLFLPALAVWATDLDEPSRALRRAAIWWTAAIVGQWLSNGALLATPACVTVLALAIWRRHGRRTVLTFALFGCAWVASVGLHYLIAIRHTAGSDYLRSYWLAGLPPESAGLTTRLNWLLLQIEPLASNPASTTVWVTFWLTAICGFALSRRRWLGTLLAAIPASAFVFGALGLVPLYQRLALWIVPSLYFGIALAADRGLSFGREGLTRRNWLHAGVALVLLAASYRVSSNIVLLGVDDLRKGRSPDSKQGLDDRAAVRWLMSLRQPGDVLMTTRLALPAVWWYAGIPVSGTNAPGGWQTDGSPIFEATYVEPGPDCGRDRLREILRGHPRVLVYAGFPEAQPGFVNLFFESVSRLGAVRERRRFAAIGHAAVVDLTAPSTGGGVDAPDPATPPLDGCIIARPAARW